MEGTQSAKRSRKPALPAGRELIIQAWDRLGRGAIGESELSEIQQSVGDDESPAAIARVLADEGAELLHPEVIEFDARWREAKIEKDSRKSRALEALLTGKPLRLSKAEALIKKLEGLRKRAEKSGDQVAAKDLVSMAVSSRQMAELLAKDRRLSVPERAEQSEITEWLKVWIQTPGLFADWLQLRRRSAEFQKKFSR
ncbi:MAG: hypothetical protein QOH41_151 [Blastocatellia bacterium]|jgi:hypothetical protein|nr:hypothetical protein [Blastocatellia bacterium]